MKKSNRKKIHDAFVAAKPLLRESNNDLNKDRFICCAITEAVIVRKITQIEASLAQKAIMDRIYPHNNIQHWLESNVGYHEVKFAGLTEVQKYRHRWLNSLIKEFSE